MLPGEEEDNHQKKQGRPGYPEPYALLFFGGWLRFSKNIKKRKKMKN